MCLSRCQGKQNTAFSCQRPSKMAAVDGGRKEEAEEGRKPKTSEIQKRQLPPFFFRVSI